MVNELGFIFCESCGEYHDSSGFVLRVTSKDNSQYRYYCLRAIRIRSNQRRLKKKMKEFEDMGQLMLDLRVNNEMV